MFSPIALFVYNRPRHTQEVVESLQRNTLAKDSTIFIFSDHAKDERNKEKIKKVREYLHSVKGFQKFHIIERERNYGLAESVIQGVTEVLKEHEQIIVLEDDLAASPYFLKYMNDALTLYREETEVVSIHGYIYPIKKTLPKTFFLRGADCWGWATWKRGWDLFERDGTKLLQELQNKHLEQSFDFDGTYPYTKMLQDQIAGKNDSWAVRWYASAFLKNKLTLYPGTSLVKNIGMDSSGTHSGMSKAFDVQVASSEIQVSRIPVEENSMARDAVKDFMRSLKPTVVERMVNKINSLLK